MLNPGNLDEIRRYTSPNSLLVIGPRGLRRVFTPFNVSSRVNSKSFTIGAVATVNKVELGKQGELLFEVGGSIYPHSWFYIRDD